jgi:23S rRNA pseudouridine1911/1915/1917 synthase
LERNPPPKQLIAIASTSDAGSRLDVFLTRHLPELSRSRLQRLIGDGRVRVDGVGDAKASLIVHAGLIAHVTVPAPTPATPSPEALPLSILHDDEDIVVIDKPAGMVVHPAAGHATGTLVNALLHHVGGLSGIGGVGRPGIVHRLDRGTSGVMIIAKHDRAHRKLARQFHDREVGKVYTALVWGAVKAGAVIELPIGRHPGDRKKMSSRAHKGRPAITRVDSVEPLGGVSLIRVTIGTGRTHQIRVHLGESGHPVVGDELYGGARRQVPPRLRAMATLKRPFLHATMLTVTHPGHGHRVTFEAALPEELSSVIEGLRHATKTKT